MNDPRIPALLVSHRRPGFYFRVLEEGEVQAGDEIVKLASGPEEMTVAEVDALLYLPGHPRQQLLRALRIPALSPGWQASFRALLDGEARQRQRRPGGGEPAPGLARLPPADRRRHRRARATRSSPSASRTPTARRSRPPARASTSPCASSPTSAQRSVLRNYSLSGPPDAGYYRISVKREPDGAASGYLHTRAPRRRPARRRRAPRHVHPRPRPRARAADQRRHRRHAGARHAARAGGRSTPSGRSGGCTARAAAATTLRRRGARAPRLAPERPHPRLLQPSGPRRPRGPRLRPRRAASRASLLAELEPPRDAEAYLCGPGAVHGRDQRRPGGDRDRRRPHPHRAVRAGAGHHAGHRGGARARAPPAGRPARDAARRSSSRAATSPSRGAATTPACSSSPRPATCPSAGRAARASATRARRRSSPARSATTPTRSSPPPTAARSSAARSRRATSCSTCEPRAGRRSAGRDARTTGPVAFGGMTWTVDVGRWPRHPR